MGDTKADLVLAPDAFLSRTLHLWEPSGWFGQVQNQAYGYLFPMGPFFWLGHVIQAPPWIIQRGWWALVLIVAFLGMVKLCGVLGVGSPTARLIGGFAFALSPRMLSIIGASSIELWPSALAPWVLIPLAIGLRRGHPKLMAAYSALAVAAVGGVNAAATSAVLPLGVLLVLMAAPGPRRRTLMLWWPGFVLLGTVWWWGPLILLGRFSPPFLDFIESASTTTFAATAFDALRGTTNWLPYLDGGYVAGGQLISEPVIIVNSAVIMALGLWGVARRDNPVGQFCVAALAVGLVLVTLGHQGTNLGTSFWQSLLDGALSPVRNDHKYDPVIRIPMVLGLVHVVTVLAAASRSRVRDALGVVILSAAALAGSTVPAWTAGLSYSGSYAEVPDYWTNATDWLVDNGPDQNALLLPASSFGNYLWGNPRDEVVQSFLSSPWAVRSAIPLTPPAFTRTLDGFESAFASGRGSVMLRDALQRSGIRYLVVRHDLAPGAINDPELVQSTLASTPGVQRAATFGPMVGSAPTQKTDAGRTIFNNAGRQSRHRAIEVFEVTGVDSSSARAQPIDEMPAAIGAPEALFLNQSMYGGDTDVVLSGDASALEPSPQRRVLLTDTARRREVTFGRVTDQRSATFTADQDYRLDRPTHDYVVEGDERWQSEAQLIGATAIRASSSASDVTGSKVDPAAQPWSAFDGDPRTAWTAGSGSTAWIEIEFDEPRSVDGLEVTMPPGTSAHKLKVSTDAGEVEVRAPAGGSTRFDGPAGETTTLRIAGESDFVNRLTFASIDIPDLELARPLVMPEMPEGWPSPTDVLLTAERGDAVCRDVQDVPRCDAGVSGLGEDGRTIDRLFTLATNQTYSVGVTALPQQGVALADAFSRGVRLRVSSTGSTEPQAGILAAIDGDPRTAWIATLADVAPRLTMTFDTPRTISELVLSTDPDVAASAVRTATLTFDDGSRRVANFTSDGRASFKPVTATGVSVDVTRIYLRSSLAFDGTGSGLPIGVSEIGVDGGEPLSTGTDTQVELECGSGPELTVDGMSLGTAVTASRRDVMSRAALPARVCSDDGLDLEAGERRVTAKRSAAFRPDTVRLGAVGPALPEAAPMTASDVAADRIDVAAADDDEQIVALRQNINPGWDAGDRPAVAVNGWMQGWQVNEAAPFEAVFTPDRWYRALLAGGAAAAGLLIVVAGFLRRRPAPDLAAGRIPRRRVRVVVGIAGFVTSAVMVGGGIGMAAAVVAAVIAIRLSNRSGDVSWLAGMGVLIAAGAYVISPWASGSWAGNQSWPQWVVLAALGAAVGAAFASALPKSLRRIAGRSITR